MTILSKLREGKRENTVTLIPGSDIKVALIALTNKEIVEISEKAIKFIANKDIDKSNQELILTMHLLSECMREVTDLNKHIGTFEEVYEYMEPYVVYELNSKYLEVQSKAVVELENLTMDEFNDIKKKLEKTQLKDLDGELQKILKNFHLMNQLKVLQKNN